MAQVKELQEVSHTLFNLDTQMIVCDLSHCHVSGLAISQQFGNLLTRYDKLERQHQLLHAKFRADTK